MAFFENLSKAITSAIRGGDAWMGPGQPMSTQNENVPTRSWDYPVAINTTPTPAGRGQYGEYNYGQLRALADAYDLLRCVIEQRKNQVAALKWKVVDHTAKDQETVRAKKAEAFLRAPTKTDNWSSWIRRLIEDLLVIDNVVIYPSIGVTGELESLDLQDPSTFKKLVALDGNLPDPPQPAYQQVVKGIPIANYTSDDLWMNHLNPRTHRLYGFSPVAYLAMTVSFALNRQMFNIDYYKEGSVPDALASVPETWTVKEVREFDNWWQSVMAGNSGERRRLKFVPIDASKVNILKKPDLTDKTDEWLARIICFAFGVSPEFLVSAMNRATAEQLHDSAQEVGIAPMLTFVKSIVDRVLRTYFDENLEFEFDFTPVMDPVQQSEVYVNYVKLGIISVDEVRERLGLPSLGVPNLVYTPQGCIPLTAFLDEDSNPLLNPPQAQPPGGEDEDEEGAEGQGAPPKPGASSHPSNAAPNQGASKRLDAGIKKLFYAREDDAIVPGVTPGYGEDGLPVKQA